MKTSSYSGVFAYVAAALLAVGFLFAMVFFPGDSAGLFPDPGTADLMREVRWEWEGGLAADDEPYAR